MGGGRVNRERERERIVACSSSLRERKGEREEEYGRKTVTVASFLPWLFGFVFLVAACLPLGNL